MTPKEAAIIVGNISIDKGDYYTISEYQEAKSMAVAALLEQERRGEAFEWCTDCKEYDQANHCCHRFSKVIKETIDEIKNPPVRVIPRDYIYSGETENDMVYKNKYTGDEILIGKDELYKFEGY